MKRNFIAALSITILASLSFPAFAQSQSRDEVLKEIRAKRSELEKLEKQFLAVPEEDRVTYAEFLREPDTGLIRLLPREKFDSETYKQNQKSMTLRGAGAYYSFTRLTHEYGFGSDISLDSGNLSVGFAGYDYGILLKLGDVPLQKVSLDTQAASFVASYAPPVYEQEVRYEQRRFSQGATVEAIELKNRVPVEANTTYLLRSMVYDKSDVLVALRVIGIDSDGSVIVLWKRLKKYSTPAVARITNLN